MPRQDKNTNRSTHAITADQKNKSLYLIITAVSAGRERANDAVRSFCVFAEANGRMHLTI